MNQATIIQKLQRNKDTFYSLLNNVPEEEYRWKPKPEKWCMLEIICHLHDEEREDFRTRLRYVLETPDKAPPSINPVGWVTKRKYMEQDFRKTLEKWVGEREASIRWLKSLTSPKWENIYEHPKLGPLSGNFYLANWLAHDFLHIRQILKLKYDYLRERFGEELKYAGTVWE